MNKSILNRAKSLARLIENEAATEGERENAKKRLESLLSKNGLSPEDFREDTRSQRIFTYKTIFERKLLSQIVGHILGKSSVSYQKKVGSKDYRVSLTDAEYRDVSNLYASCREGLKEAFDDAFTAFLAAQGLLAPASDNAPLDIESLLRWKRIIKIKEGMKQLEHNTNKKLASGN